MGNLTERLTALLSTAGRPLIGLDTSVFIYQLEDHPIYRPPAHEILEGVEEGRWEAITSVLTLTEINVQPIKLGRWDIARRYEALLVNFPNLQVVELNRDIARRASFLRAEYGLRPADVLQVAACLQHGCRVFVTNDRQLKRLQPVINIILLADSNGEYHDY